MEEIAADLDNKFQETEKKLDNVAWKVEQLVKVDTTVEGMSGSGDTLTAAQLKTSVQVRDLNDVDFDLRRLLKKINTALHCNLPFLMKSSPFQWLISNDT